MAEPMSDERFRQLEAVFASDLRPRHGLAAELWPEVRRLRAALAARPAPIGYAVAFRDEMGVELAQRGYPSAASAYAARADYIRPSWQVVALIPVPPQEGPS